MTREQVDKAWLDVARDAGRQDREGEVYLLHTEIERLRAALQSLTRDPPATLDEPDTDAEVVIKMREITRRALEPKP